MERNGTPPSSRGVSNSVSIVALNSFKATDEEIKQEIDYALTSW